MDECGGYTNAESKNIINGGIGHKVIRRSWDKINMRGAGDEQGLLYGITCCGREKAAADKISKKLGVEHLTVVDCLHRICFLLGLQFLDNAIV